MTLPLQLAIAIAAGLVASLLILFLELAQQPVLLVAAVLVACCIAPLLRRQGSTEAGGKDVSTETGREEGEVKWFNVSKGFGFIRRQNGEEIFVHYRSIQGPDDRSRKDGGRRRGLRDGQRVSFVVVNSDKGPQAEEVQAMGKS